VLKFQAVAEKTAKDARGLLYFAAPGIYLISQTPTFAIKLTIQMLLGYIED